MEAKFNVHGRGTIEFNVKSPNLAGISEELYEHEYLTGSFTNLYGKRLFEELGYAWLRDWSFDGRSNGWFVLESDKDADDIPTRTLLRIEKLVERYYKNYNVELLKHYK